MEKSSKDNFLTTDGELFFNQGIHLETNVTSDDSIDQLLSQLTGDNQQIASTFSSQSVEIVQCNNEEGVRLQDPPNLEEILSLSEDILMPSFHNVSVLNSACQQLLKEIESQLLALLKKNQKEQEIVQGFINANGKGSYFDNTKKTFLKCAGMPYFKDMHGFQPPPNEDILRKQKENKLLPIDFIKSFPIWSNADANTLINSVKNYDLTKPESIDWMKISVINMEGKYSPSECKSKWLMNLSPSINRSKWSLKEIQLLKVLCEKYNYQNWDEIAVQLGTNRTGLQCCIQYMTNTFPTQGKWTKEEDETLQNLVKKYKVKNYIPWAKVVWHFESRSLKQCQERYAYHLGDIKKGSFSKEEDFLIVYLASKLKNFGEVAKFLPNRVATQVRARYEYLVELSMPKFSKEEDELLTKLMTQYPRDWGKISENFTHRSKVQCRRRWGYLQRQIKLTEDIQSETDDDEECNSQPEENTKNTKNNNVDAENYYKLNKNVYLTSKPSQTDKKHTQAYSKLLDYYKDCHKFLFGPKPRLLINPEDKEKLVKKMKVTMKSLAISHIGPLNGFNMNVLSNNCEFDKEDLDILTELNFNEQDKGTRQFEISKKIIPPNYITLVGLRSLMLGCQKIKTLCSFYRELPPTTFPAQSFSTAAGSNARLLCSDAKKLFKFRLKTLFAFPLILSNISPSSPKKIFKTKTRKPVKPLSKHRRKEHAKLMNAAYREKLKTLNEKLPNSNDTHPNHCNVNKSEPIRKRSCLLKNGNEELVPPLKKRAVRSTDLPNS